MISFKAFLTENQFKDYEQLVQVIKRDCQPYLNLTEELIYRGISNSSSIKNSINKLQVRADRRPRDSVKPLHNALNEYLKKKFNHPYRENSLFATGKKSIAIGYVTSRNHEDVPKDTGTVCIIFPIGQFDFCYSRKLIDVSWWLTTEGLEEFKESFMEKYPNEGTGSVTYFEELEKFFDKEIDYVENEDIDNAIGKNRELMIKCKEYYAIPLALGSFKLRDFPDAFDYRKLQKDLQQ